MGGKPAHVEGGRPRRRATRIYPLPVRVDFRDYFNNEACNPKWPGRGTFYYTYTDHLGNITALSQRSSYVADSLARFDPFGNYRTWPSSTVNPDITNHGFTGHRHNNTGTYDLKLIYMNARYYLPEVGRFISPDTIVPEPGNPQSFNRYSYTRNNPVNFTDPTGHREIGANDSELLPVERPPSIAERVAQGTNVYGIVFSADEGESWTDGQMTLVLRAAANVDRQLRIAGQFAAYLPGAAFRHVYGSYIMLRSARTQWTDGDGVVHDILYGAETFGSDNTIEFYDPAFGTRAISFILNVVHELGHAFNSEVVSRSAGTPYLDLGAALDVDGQLFGLDMRAGMDKYPWQQSRQITDGELFADYFLNWVYGSFLSNEEGAGQFNWMNQHMPGWLD